MRDAMISDQERHLLERTAEALRVNASAIDELVDSWSGDSAVNLRAGMRVCFTGAATYPDGTELRSTKLQQIADSGCYQPTASPKRPVTCSSRPTRTPSPGKAGKAHRYGIPVVAGADFLVAQPRARVPAVWA